MDFLLIRFSSLGDVILATSVIENIHANGKQHRVDILTKEQYAPVFFENPSVNRIIFGPSRSKEYDYMIDLHDNLRSHIMRFFIPARKRLTYDKAAIARRIFLHAGKKDSALADSVVKRYNDPLREAGLTHVTYKPKIYLTESEKSAAAQMSGEEPFIALAPGARWKTKHWFEEKYISLIIHVKKELGLDTVLLGGVDDIELNNRIMKGVGLLRKYVVNLTGRTGIRELAAVISRASCLVTMDSAPLHIGWAVDTPAVALFGPTVKEFGFQPEDSRVVILEKDLDCRPCSLHGSDKCKFKDRACMQRIEVYEVSNAVKSLL